MCPPFFFYVACFFFLGPLGFEVGFRSRPFRKWVLSNLSKKTNNPNPSPIGKRFGLYGFGSMWQKRFFEKLCAATGLTMSASQLLRSINSIRFQKLLSPSLTFSIERRGYTAPPGVDQPFVGQLAQVVKIISYSNRNGLWEIPRQGQAFSESPEQGFPPRMWGTWVSALSPWSYLYLSAILALFTMMAAKYLNVENLELYFTYRQTGKKCAIMKRHFM